jgi:monoamine oxidase
MILPLSRRQFMTGAAALAAAPALGQVPSSGEVDIAVIGAGAAGIAAARRIAAAGRSYALLEAMGRVGGRVSTETGIFGVAHDRGAYRLNAPVRNPLAAIARNERFRLYEPSAVRRLYVGEREARDSEYDNLTAAVRRAHRAIVAAGEAGHDIAAVRSLPDLGDWQATVAFVLGPLNTSKDLDEVSTVDFARAEDRADDLVCREGLGRLLAAASKPLTVELNMPVERIDSRRRGHIALESPRGSLRAGAVIVTASTDVLLSGRIEFDQPMPRRTADALARLSLGTYDRLVLELSGNPLKFGDNERMIFKTSDRRATALVGRVGGTDLAYAEFPGRFGRELSDAGEAAMAAFVGEIIADHFGTEAKNRIGRTEAVRWSKEPWIMGGISAAAPGTALSRGVLAEPVHDRIFLAGEAAHGTLWGTVAGAWLSGERAADAAIRLLKRAAERPEPPAKGPARKTRRR